MVDLSINVLESFELEQIFWILLFPDVLSFDELLGLHFCFGISYLDVVAFGSTHLFVLLQALISVLEVSARILSEVITNDSVYRGLRSVRPSKRKLFLWQRNLVSTALESTHSKRNSAVVALSVNVILGCCDISFDNSFIVEKFEVSWVVIILVEFRFMNFPRCANFRCSFLCLLVRSAVRKIKTWQSASRWLRLSNLVFHNHVVASASK